MSTENEILSAARETLSVVRRLETKTTRGFAELGVDINSEPGWLRVNDTLREVNVTTLGRSMSVMRTEMRREGATQIGKEYAVLHNGRHVGTIVLTAE